MPRIAGTILVAILLLVACSGSPPDDGEIAPSPSVPSGPPEARSYSGLEEIAEAIGCEGVRDVGTGGNPGLSAFGICSLGRHNLDIYMVTDNSWDNSFPDFPNVRGPGWMIVCPTGEKAARLVQNAIGGELRLPEN